MRIIGGALGGRKITPPAKMPFTRPTTDLAKEGLFNIIGNNLDITRLKTLDLFGGTGCISYELASRGARDLTIVENDPKMYAFICQEIQILQLEHCRVLKVDVFRFIEQCKETFDFIFAGPPYALENIDELPGLIFRQGLLNEGGWFVLEHTDRHRFEKYPFFRTARKYGSTIFSIFVNREIQEKK